MCRALANLDEVKAGPLIPNARSVSTAAVDPLIISCLLEGYRGTKRMRLVTFQLRGAIQILRSMLPRLIEHPGACVELLACRSSIAQI